MNAVREHSTSARASHLGLGGKRHLDIQDLLAGHNELAILGWGILSRAGTFVALRTLVAGQGDSGSALLAMCT